MEAVSKAKVLQCLKTWICKTSAIFHMKIRKIASVVCPCSHDGGHTQTQSLSGFEDLNKETFLLLDQEGSSDNYQENEQNQDCACGSPESSTVSSSNCTHLFSSFV